MMRALPLALAALTLTAPAAAQDGSEPSGQRTPENARLFIAQLPERFQIEVSAKGSLESGIGYRVSALRNEGRCVDVIEGLPRWYVLRSSQDSMINRHLGNGSDPSLFTPHLALIAARGLPQAPYRIDWSTVDSVETPVSDAGQPYKKVLALSTRDLKVRLQFPSEELAERSKLAMETLRVACDASIATGF